MVEIELTQGQVAMVDDEDYENLMKWKWHAYFHRKTWYAKRNEGRNPFHKTVYMHVVILNPPDGMFTDHLDGNGLNNQKSNLRICTTQQNNWHRGKQSNNTSGYKGVFFSKRDNKWYAAIRVNGKLINLGYQTTPEDAAIVYDTAAKKYHGDFAVTNF